jgi:hypothetical protein
MNETGPTKRVENVSGRCAIPSKEQLDTRARGCRAFTMVKLSQDLGIRGALSDFHPAVLERVTRNADGKQTDDHHRRRQERGLKERG